MDPISRRRALHLAGAAGAAYLLAGRTIVKGTEAQAAASCVLTPAKTEGPYFVDERLNRSDIRIDPVDGSVQDGVKLTLRFAVVRSDGDCAPVGGAQVDVWHANAGGLYSDVSANGTVGHKYLRGYQVTDVDGVAEFVTIFPGWYRGRAIHIHFKIRKGDLEFTSQIFFDEATTQQVLTDSAYSARGNPDTTNGTDNIYGSDGSQLTVALAGDGSGWAGRHVHGRAVRAARRRGRDGQARAPAVRAHGGRPARAQAHGRCRRAGGGAGADPSLQQAARPQARRQPRRRPPHRERARTATRARRTRPARPGPRRRNGQHADHPPQDQDPAPANVRNPPPAG